MGLKVEGSVLRAIGLSNVGRAGDLCLKGWVHTSCFILKLPSYLAVNPSSQER